MLNTKFYYAPDKMTLVANEERRYKDLIKNNVFEFFANTFLVECSVCEEIGEIAFAAISDGRFEAERIGTRFTEKGKVEKFSLSVCRGKLHIQQIAQNERKLKEAGLYVVESKVENNVLQMEYVKKALMEEVFVETCRAGNKEKAYGILDVLYQQILNSSDEADWENNILYSLKIAEPDRKNTDQF